MNSHEPGIGGRLRTGALTVAVLSALAACAMHPKPAPPVAKPAPKPVHAAPAPRPRPAPAAIPTPPPAQPPAATVLDSHNPDSDRDRIKKSLANEDRDALAPADVGYYMDVLLGRLKQVAGRNFAITRRGDRIEVELPGDAAFDAGSARIGVPAHQAISTLSNVLTEYRMTLVTVRIPADDAATRATAPGLSAQRAQAIARDLADAGIAIRRIVVADPTPERRARIALLIEPIVRTSGAPH